MSLPLHPRKTSLVHPANSPPPDRTPPRNRIHTPTQTASPAPQSQTPPSEDLPPDGSCSSIAPTPVTESARHSARLHSPASARTENNPPPWSPNRRLPTASRA